MRALVTGGAGFIGWHVAAALRARGDDVTVLDSLDARVHGAFEADLPAGVRFIRGDVRDPSAVRAAAGDGVDVVFHEAAMVGFGNGDADRAAFFDVNVDGTLTLLRALARMPWRPHRVVLASSMAVYGEGAYRCAACAAERDGHRDPAAAGAGRFDPACGACSTPLQAVAATETHALDPQNAYAASKLAQERVALATGRAMQLPVVALRYHNVYGPRMPRDTPYAGVASLFKSRVLAGEAPLVTEDGTQLRDFVHVTDVAQANLLAATAPRDAVAFEAFNIGSGAPRPIVDVAAALAAAGGGATPVITGTFRPGDARHVFGAITKARDVLGYRPAVTFDDGMAAFFHEPVRAPPVTA